MKHKKAILLGIIFIIFTSSFITSPKIAEPSVHHPQFGKTADILAQYDNPRPEWKKIIEKAYSSLETTREIDWQQTDDYYYSALLYDYLIDQHYL